MSCLESSLCENVSFSSPVFGTESEKEELLTSNIKESVSNNNNNNHHHHHHHFLEPKLLYINKEKKRNFRKLENWLLITIKFGTESFA